MTQLENVASYRADTSCCKRKPLLVSCWTGNMVINSTALLQPGKLTASVHTRSLVHTSLRSYGKSWLAELRGELSLSNVKVS